MDSTSPPMLFTAEELRNAVRYPVDDAEAAGAESIVWGRIKPILNLTERPAARDETVWSIAVQLGILFHENPGLWARSSTGVDSTDYDTLAAVNSLLDDLRGYVDGTSGTSAGSTTPRGAFPRAEAYPEPSSRPHPALGMWTSW